MKTEKKIISLFIKEKRPKTIREIAKKIKADYKITHIAVQRLLNKGILLAETIGKSTLCRLNAIYYGIEIYEAENKKREDLLKNKNIKQLYKEVMKKVKTSFFMFIIFGSFAKGKQAKNSDIDIMFVSNEKNFDEKIHNVFSLLPIKTHYLVFIEEEFIRMKNSKESNVVQEAIENNIILYGIENYYRLKNA
ncbi:MAG: nucleotidyltransferase domain-containing protein [Nanoarchaeota archaeon]